MPNKIPIVIPTYNRPEFLIQVVTALKLCDNIDLFKIYTSEEPGYPAVQTIFNNIDFIEIDRHINEHRLGCNRNVIQAIDRGFDHGDFVVVLEDDIVPGKDFLNLCLWAMEPLKDNTDLFCVTGFERLPGPFSLEQQGLVHRKKWFLPWGWATWKHKWENAALQMVNEYSKTVVNIPSWDCNFSDQYFNINNLYILQPTIARTKNIGVYGQYVPSAAWHKREMSVQGFTDDDPAYFRKPNEFIYNHEIIT